MAALQMFELGKLSSGKQRSWLASPALIFFERCGRYHVSIMNYSGDEIAAELTSDIS